MVHVKALHTVCTYKKKNVVYDSYQADPIGFMRGLTIFEGGRRPKGKLKNFTC